MEYKGLFMAMIIWVLPLFISHASEADSIGVESKDDQIYVLHRVEAKETLYSLSRRYGATIASIVENNQITANNLTVGEILRIPWLGPITHLVRTGETLYSISRLYGTSVAEIKALNNLDANELEIGKVLTVVRDQKPRLATRDGIVNASKHVVEPLETLYSISQKYEVSLEEIKQWNQLTDNSLRIGDTLYLRVPEKTVIEAIENTPVETQSARPETVVSRPVTIVNNPQNDLAPVTEQGIAAVIDGSTDTKKYLALHPSAPVGTIMRVRNEMTNLSVFVRVVGKLPATGSNNNVLIRLSEAAQSALGALDERFRVELSYVPNQ